jgi:hypothetical protein
MTDIENRVYDANEFDWEDESGVQEDQQKVSEVEALIRESLQVASGVEDSWLRPSAVDNDRARIAYNVPFALNENQKAGFEELVGDIRTITYNATGYHDHPLSHCLTEISEDLVVRQFGSEPFVSVWGNASRHRRLGHQGAKTVSSRVVPHDWFRNRGMEEAVTDIYNFKEAGGHKKYRLFLATHALYYMSLDQVASWMGDNMDAEFHCIVHRHNKSMGHLNKGELKYTTDSDGYVRQVNPLTGFTYSHRSIEPLFHVDSCQVLGGKVGLTWDINKLAGDNYHVKFVLCDVNVASAIVDPWMLVKKDREVYVRGDVTVYRVLGLEWYVYHGPGGQTLLEDVELYDRLRRTIAGKERTPRAKSELMAMCRRLANKNDIISIHQGFAHEIAPERMADYVNAAFYADVKHELEVALAHHRDNKQAVDTLNKYYAEGIVPADYTNIAKIGRAVSSPFNALVGLLNESHNGPRHPLLGQKLHSIIEQVPPDPFYCVASEDSIIDHSKFLYSFA